LLGGLAAAPAVLGAGTLALCCPAGRTARAEGAGHYWSYADDTGPDRWGDIAPEFRVCSTGQRQSPIDLGGAGLNAAIDPVFIWQPFAARVDNNGHTIQVSPAEGTPSPGHVDLDGARFEFLEFHFHHPSEHAVGGRRWPLEVHLVHKGAGGRLAVIGIMFRPGRENKLLAAVLGLAPAGKGSVAAPGPVDLMNFLPASTASYRYAGSLTTPPCSEIVSWVVLREPIEAAAGQIEVFAGMFPMNARPLQPGFERSITLDLF
jgi:carbonic anhydrase